MTVIRTKNRFFETLLDTLCAIKCCSGIPISLFLWLLPVSLVCARPTHHSPWHWQENTTLTVEVGGLDVVPYRWLLEGAKMPCHVNKGNNKTGRRFGLLCGYEFPLADSVIKLGPEVGLSLETGKRFTWPYRYKIAEQLLHVPLALRLAL